MTIQSFYWYQWGWILAFNVFLDCIGRITSWIKQKNDKLGDAKLHSRGRLDQILWHLLEETKLSLMESVTLDVSQWILMVTAVRRCVTVSAAGGLAASRKSTTVICLRPVQYKHPLVWSLYRIRHFILSTNVKTYLFRRLRVAASECDKDQWRCVVLLLCHSKWRKNYKNEEVIHWEEKKPGWSTLLKCKHTHTHSYHVWPWAQTSLPQPHNVGLNNILFVALA